jgi:hypothetical protein
MAFLATVSSEEEPPGEGAAAPLPEDELLTSWVRMG